MTEPPPTSQASAPIPLSPLKPGPVRTGAVISAAVTLVLLIASPPKGKGFADQATTGALLIVMAAAVGMGVGAVVRAGKVIWRKRSPRTRPPTSPVLMPSSPPARWSVPFPPSTVPPMALPVEALTAPANLPRSPMPPAPPPLLLPPGLDTVRVRLRYQAEDSRGRAMSSSWNGTIWHLDLSPQGCILYNMEGKQVFSFPREEAEMHLELPVFLMNRRITVWGEKGAHHTFANDPAAVRGIKRYLGDARDLQGLKVARDQRTRGLLALGFGIPFALMGLFLLVVNMPNLLAGFPRPEDSAVKGVGYGVGCLAVLGIPCIVLGIRNLIHYGEIVNRHHEAGLDRPGAPEVVPEPIMVMPLGPTPVESDEDQPVAAVLVEPQPQAPWSGADEWYYAVDNRKSGPFTFGELQNFAAHGLLQPGEMVLQKGSPRWMAARSIPGLFP